MRNRHWIVWIVIGLMGVSLACNALKGGSQPVPTTVVPTEAPTATPKPQPTATPRPTDTLEPTATSAPVATPKPAATPEPAATAEEGVALEIINNSGRDIHFIYISLTDAEDWGEDWLNGEVIPDGGSYTITGIPVGVYDLQAEDENNAVIENVWEAEIAEDTSWTVTGGASLEVYNASEDIITALYVSPSDSDDWGEDRLGGTALKNGGSFVVEGLDDAVLYDAKVTDADGNTIESIYNVSLNGWYTWYVYGRTDLPTNAVLRFEDEFSDNRNNWGATRETDDVHYMPPQDGEYCILIKVPNLTAWEWYEPFRPAEFVAEVACLPEAGTDATCGLGFGPDGDNLYWFEVSPAEQMFALFLLQNDEWQDPLIDWTESKNIVPSGWNYLSIERVGGNFSVFVNGVMQGQVESTLFPTGRVGIGGSTYDDGNVTVCLDNLRVWRIEK